MQKFIILAICLFVLVGWLTSCSDNPAESPEEADPSLAKLTCVQCHLDQDKLMALATEEPPPSGEASEG